MLQSLLNNFGWRVDNVGTLSSSAQLGKSISAAANNAKGAWSQIFANTDTVYDSYLLWVNVNIGYVAATLINQIWDIGVDPAGGTNYQVVVPNLLAGAAVNTTQHGIQLWFPIFIPAGSSVAVRGQNNTASARAAFFAMRLFGRPTRPEIMKVGSFVDTYGVDTTTSKGVDITAATTGTKGAWTAIGSAITRDIWFAQIGLSCGMAAASALVGIIDVALDSGANDLLMQNELFITSSSPAIGFINPGLILPRRIEAGTQFYARATIGSGTSIIPNIAIHGVGG